MQAVSAGFGLGAVGVGGSVVYDEWNHPVVSTFEFGKDLVKGSTSGAVAGAVFGAAWEVTLPLACLLGIREAWIRNK